MKRTRPNRRKPPKRELPKLPAVPMPSVNWHAIGMTGAALAVCGLAFALGRELLELPVRRLVIEGSHQRVSDLEVEAAAKPALDESFVGLDLYDLRDHVAAIAWVDTVDLKRVWPDTLQISITEHRAAARWGETGLLNTHGELFAEDSRYEYPELPRLAGPAGSHRRVAEFYLRIRDRLAASGLSLTMLRMDGRGAFTLDFNGGLVVRIGRDDADERIDRFFAVALPQLAADLGRVRYFDMRYTSGFAIGWREAPAADTRLARLDDDG
jgi:cell division protein FtsQ